MTRIDLRAAARHFQVAVDMGDLQPWDTAYARYLARRVHLRVPEPVSTIGRVLSMPKADGNALCECVHQEADASWWWTAAIVLGLVLAALVRLGS